MEEVRRNRVDYSWSRNVSESSLWDFIKKYGRQSRGRKVSKVLVVDPEYQNTNKGPR